MKTVLLQPCYILHRYAYRETSFLIELFSLEYGRLSLLAKGIRRRHSPAEAWLQPFKPLLISWSGKGELFNLIHVELNISDPHCSQSYLQRECLFAGFYLNELLMRLLQKGEPYPTLYTTYAKTLSSLQSSKLNQRDLRLFEKHFLEELGYGRLVKSNSESGGILPEEFYLFTADKGFTQIDKNQLNHEHPSVFSGKSLLAFREGNWCDEVSLHDAKRLTRLLLAPLLGEKPLKSRALFT